MTEANCISTTLALKAFVSLRRLQVLSSLAFLRLFGLGYLAKFLLGVLIRNSVLHVLTHHRRIWQLVMEVHGQLLELLLSNGLVDLLIFKDVWDATINVVGATLLNFAMRVTICIHCY